MLKRLRVMKLYINFKKLKFHLQKIKFLNVLINVNKLRINFKKIIIIKNVIITTIN